MKARRRIASLAVATATVFAPLAIGAATPAHADRCEPEELVFGAGTSPIDEADHPLCSVMLQYVYPAICSNYTTLLLCTQTVRLNPGYRPAQLLPTYDPDLGRIVCNIYLYANSSGTCTFVGQPETGGIAVTTDQGSVLIPTLSQEK